MGRVLRGGNFVGTRISLVRTRHARAAETRARRKLGLPGPCFRRQRNLSNARGREICGAAGDDRRFAAHACDARHRAQPHHAGDPLWDRSSPVARSACARQELCGLGDHRRHDDRQGACPIARWRRAQRAIQFREIPRHGANTGKLPTIDRPHRRTRLGRQDPRGRRRISRPRRSLPCRENSGRDRSYGPFLFRQGYGPAGHRAAPRIAEGGQFLGHDLELRPPLGTGIPVGRCAALRAPLHRRRTRSHDLGHGLAAYALSGQDAERRRSSTWNLSTALLPEPEVQVKILVDNPNRLWSARMRG